MVVAKYESYESFFLKLRIFVSCYEFLTNFYDFCAPKTQISKNWVGRSGKFDDLYVKNRIICEFFMS